VVKGEGDCGSGGPASFSELFSFWTLLRWGSRNSGDITLRVAAQHFPYSHSRGAVYSVVKNRQSGFGLERHLCLILLLLRRLPSWKGSLVTVRAAVAATRSEKRRALLCSRAMNSVASVRHGIGHLLYWPLRRSCLLRLPAAAAVACSGERRDFSARTFGRNRLAYPVFSGLYA